MTATRCVYLDHNATTPCLHESLALFQKHESTVYGNPSSMHAIGRKALSLLDDSRERLATLISAECSEIFFTSGGTESNNLAIWSAIHSGKKRGKKRILVSSIEHSSVLDAAMAFALEFEMSIEFIRTLPDGTIDLKDLQSKLDDQVAMLCLMHSNNETGVIQPVFEALQIAAPFEVTSLVDAIQSFGKVPLNMQRLPCDFLTLSSHKIYGPKGVGAIYVSKKSIVESIFKGGHQEKGVRPGTESVSLIASFIKSAEIVCDEMPHESPRQQLLIRELRDRLITQYDGMMRFNTGDQAIPNTLNVTFEDVSASSLLVALDLDGVCVSAGSACTAGSPTPSHVIQAMTGSNQSASSSIRYSVGKSTTLDDIWYAATKTCEHAKRIRTQAN